MGSAATFSDTTLHGQERASAITPADTTSTLDHSPSVIIPEMETNLVHIERLPALQCSKSLFIPKNKRLSLSASSPPTSTVGPSHWIRFTLWFNTYRKFFVLSTSFNITLVFLAVLNVWEYPQGYTGAFVLGNLFVAVLVRNELFGRLLYLVANTLFAKWTPLWWRLTCTSVLQHLGGIHSGCAVSGFIWLVYRVISMYAIRHAGDYDPILVFGVVTNAAVLVSIMSAFPWVRNTRHDSFERYHRFVGWLGLLSTWVFVILGDSYDLETQQWDPRAGYLVHQQDFWFVLGMTIFIAAPWLTVRRVRVDVEVPSPKVAILRFERGMQQGLLGRIARSSVLEYHAFGIISEGPHAQYHYMICGVQGDFTRSLVQDPPRYVWTRELKFAGVSNTSTLYRRGIRVCTGTGIGAALGTCLQSEDWFLIWIGSDQERTFGPTISRLIHDNIKPEQMILWDSKKQGGRPNVMHLIKETYRTWGAEVVFITSNYQGNSDLMRGCREARIPAFGTLWDF